MITPAYLTHSKPLVQWLKEKRAAVLVPLREQNPLLLLLLLARRQTSAANPTAAQSHFNTR